MATCCDCGQELPPVPGLYMCCVAHTHNGRPCIDGQRESPNETCTAWGVQYMADCAWPALVPLDDASPRQRRLMWQRDNLDHLDLT